MNMKKIFTSVIIIILSQSVFGQSNYLQTPCASTSQGTAGNFIISYTIGEMVLVNTYKSNGLIVSQGILQPYVSPYTGAPNGFDPGEITVFPNPTPNLLSIQYNILKFGKMSIQLYNAIGQRLITEEIVINSFSTKRYDLSRYSKGAYMLLLFYTSDDGSLTKKGTYKIIKG